MALNINGTTGISGVDGSVSAPALTGTDSNTGITFPAADTIKFATGGVERMSITNSGVSGITAGITMADTWGLSQSATYNSNDYIDSYWTRQTGLYGGNVGSAMTQTNGVFAFPTTGMYLCLLTIGFYNNSSSGFQGVQWKLSEDGGSNYNTLQATGYVGGGSGAHYSRLIVNDFIRVNTTNIRIRFQLVLTGATVVQGGHARTSLMVLRYGDSP